MLAGVNPIIIRRLEEFPPTSKLYPTVYGNQTSTIKWEHIEKNMNGLTVDEALKHNKLVILDHHDAFMPHLSRINTTTTKTYASRTVLLLQDDGTLKPLAIELSLPHPQGDKHGTTSQVFTPAEHGIEGSIWQLAKAYVAVEHSCSDRAIYNCNQWTLKCASSGIQALSTPLQGSMNINALATHTPINSGGILELTVFPSKYALEMCSAIYRGWVFPEQALPADLLERGMAVADSTKPHGLRLLIEDYPYVLDGLEAAIEELRNVGHGDLKDEPWWPQMEKRNELVQACTIIIWVASALHAAVNFGRYPYAGYLPNRPTVSRRIMPEPGSPEYAELASNPDLAFLKTITAQFQTLLGVLITEILLRQASDEIYLGQRDNPEWTSDSVPRDAFKRFGAKLEEIENQIIVRNNDPKWRNRTGPVKAPYTLLIPNASGHSQVGGLIGKGIPNSIS